MVSIFTDGACVPNPGNGGWAFVVLRDGQIIFQDQGRDKHTTSNRMELTAILKALEWVKDIDENIIIYSDSTYSVNSITVWYKKWAKKKKIIKSRLNLDLIKPCVDLYVSRRNLQITWIRGHNGNKYNEYTDGLAVEAMRM